MQPGQGGNLRLKLRNSIPYLRRIAVGGIYGAGIKTVIVLRVEGKRMACLPHIGYACNSPRFGPRLAEDRKQDRRQNRNNSDDNEQFNQRKRPVAS